MSPTVFVVAASIWVFFCVLVAVVSAAAVDAPGRYRKAAIVGLVVGVIFGIASVGLLANVGVVGRLFTLLAMVRLDRFASVLISVLLAILAGAIAGAAAGAVATRNTVGVRRCATVGVAFGLVMGIANAAVAPVWANALIPALEAVGIGRLSAVWFGAATMVSGVMLDLSLAAGAFRFVRRRWGAVPPATATRTC